MGNQQIICTATTASTGERCRRIVAKVSAERCASHLNAEEKAVRDRIEKQEQAARQARRDQVAADREHLSRYLHQEAREAWDRGTDRADAIWRVMSMLAFEHRTRGVDTQGEDILEVEESPPVDVSEHQCPSTVFGARRTGHDQLLCQLAACQSYLGHLPDLHYSPGGQCDVRWDDSDALPAKAPRTLNQG